MTDIVVHSSRQSSLDLAPEAWGLASRIANTEFVPAALRGKPEAVLAAMLTGHELGIPPMQSLAKIHVIDGRPAMAAELMRALILRAGHDFWVEESTPTKCTVAGKRAGSERESRVTWTMDDAKRAGLDGRQNWRKYPGDMLLARATAKLARALFADVIAGVSYSVEELTDGDEIDGDVGGSVVPIEGAKPKGTRRRASKPAVVQPPAADAATEDVPAAVVEVLPPLPGEDGYVGEFEEAEVVDGLGEAASTGGEGGGVGPSLPSPPSSPGGEHGQETPVDTVESPADGDSGAASPPGAAVDEQVRRAQQLAMAARDAGLTDEQRHAVIGLVTAGRTQSGKDLDDVEYAQVRAVLVKIRHGALRVVTGVDGTVRLDEPGEPTAGAVSDDETWWDVPRWKTYVKEHGKTQVATLRKAREVALELGVEPPSGFAEWTDGRISAAVREWVEAA